MNELNVARSGALNNALRKNNKMTAIMRESSIMRTAKQNIKQSFNDITINGKRVKD